MYLLLIAILFLHWVGDFVFQTDEMALNKSKSNMWLLKHVVVYYFFMLPFGPVYAFVNFCAHFCTDYVTSRINSYFWRQDRRHAFFVSVGFDQFLHAAVLIATMPLMGWWW